VDELMADFPPLDEGRSTQEKVSAADYVGIIRDALTLKKNVGVTRNFSKLKRRMGYVRAPVLLVFFGLGWVGLWFCVWVGLWFCVRVGLWCCVWVGLWFCVCGFGLVCVVLWSSRFIIFSGLRTPQPFVFAGVHMLG
jgi:hypothetical protein